MNFLQSDRRIILSTLGGGFSTTVSGIIYAYNGVQTIIEPFIRSSYLHHYGTALDRTALGIVWGTMAAMTPIGAVFGSLSMDCLSRMLGKKRAGLLLNCFIALIGALISGLAKPLDSFELLFLGRLLMGFCLGLGTFPI